MSIFLTVFMLFMMMFGCPAVAETASPMTETSGKNLLTYTQDHKPWDAVVIAYDPISPKDTPTNFDVIPLDSELGEMSEKTTLFVNTAKAFEDLSYFEINPDPEIPEERWRFSILYSMSASTGKTIRTFQLDFFDYTNDVRLTIADINDEEKAILHESFVIIPREVSASLESVYIERVAKLKRIPESEERPE